MSTSNLTLDDASNLTLDDGSVLTINQNGYAAQVTFEAQYVKGLWWDITGDVLGEPAYDTGIGKVSPTALVADVGNLSFELNNSAANKAATAGYYSPGHASQRAGFQRGLPVRVKTVYGGTVRYQKFYVKSIKPTPGIYGPRRSLVIAQDYIGLMGKRKIGRIGVQTSATSDDLVTALVADMPNAPSNVSLDAGPDEFTSAFTDLLSDKMTPLSILQRICQSDWSRAWIDGDSADGETLTLSSRSSGSGASSVTVNDVMTNVEPEVSLERLVNLVAVTVYPSEEAASLEVIYTHPKEEAIGPGETLTFTARFADTNSGTRFCAVEVRDPPTVNTDYRASSAAGDSGNDMSSSLTVTFDVGADALDASTKNNHATATAYLNLFAPQGKPIRRYDQYEYTAQADDLSDGEYSLVVSMPYNSDGNVAEALADKILSDWGDETSVRSYGKVEFYANRSATLLDLALNKPLGTKVTIQETQSSLDMDGILIGRGLTFRGNGIINARIVVDPVFGVGGWMLGTSGASELGETTTLGF